MYQATDSSGEQSQLVGVRAPCPCPFRSWLSWSFAQIQTERRRRKKTAWCQTHSQVSLLTFKTKHRGQKEGPEKEGPSQHITAQLGWGGRVVRRQSCLFTEKEGRHTALPLLYPWHLPHLVLVSFSSMSDRTGGREEEPTHPHPYILPPAALGPELSFHGGWYWLPPTA